MRVEVHASQEAQNRKDYTTAEKEYRVALRMAPRVPQAYLNLGLIYQLQERRPEAMEMFRRALKFDPRMVGANFFLGVDYWHQGRSGGALPQGCGPRKAGFGGGLVEMLLSESYSTSQY